mmetsp:Transcript_2359/g.8242  ORF Transcript_2359/g.8242 Transcript_2359/m.8242 type:complete len:216 (-) Transcript_2359:907-1554(-)
MQAWKKKKMNEFINFHAAVKEKENIRKMVPVAKMPNIVVIIMDAVSRVAFINRMPQTIEYMQGLSERNDISVHQYFRYHVLGHSTGTNVPHLLGGCSNHDGGPLDWWAGNCSCSAENLERNSRWLQTRLSQHGYVSAWSDQTGTSRGRDYFGKNHYDHYISIYDDYPVRDENGRWTKTGEGNVTFCVTSRDSGQQCLGGIFTHKMIFKLSSYIPE